MEAPSLRGESAVEHEYGRLRTPCTQSHGWRQRSQCEAAEERSLSPAPRRSAENWVFLVHCTLPGLLHGGAPEETQGSSSVPKGPPPISVLASVGHCQPQPGGSLVSTLLWEPRYKDPSRTNRNDVCLVFPPLLEVSDELQGTSWRRPQTGTVDCFNQKETLPSCKHSVDFWLGPMSWSPCLRSLETCLPLPHRTGPWLAPC